LSGLHAQASSHRAEFRPTAGGANGDHFQPRYRIPFALKGAPQKGLFLGFCIYFLRGNSLVTSSLAASYDNVGTYEFEKVLRVRIPPAPPASLNCREIPPAFPSKYAKDANFSRFFLSKPDCGERTAGQRGRYFPGFSLEGTRAVRFRGRH
jgi:hypothetical protein